jgi:hypothetical protein
MSATEVLRRITSALGAAGIPYMLTGSFASAHHGAPRSTQDIDIVIAPTPEQLQVFIKNLPATQYYADLDASLDAHQRKSLFNIIDLDTGWKIDLIIRKSRPFSREEFERRLPASVAGLTLFVASAEDVIIAKLEWSTLAKSQRQIEDAAGILRLRWNSLDRSYLKKWIRDLGLEKEWHQARRIVGM